MFLFIPVFWIESFWASWVHLGMIALGFYVSSSYNNSHGQTIMYNNNSHGQ